MFHRRVSDDAHSYSTCTDTKNCAGSSVCVYTMFVCVLMSEFVYACMKQNGGATNTNELRKTTNKCRQLSFPGCNVHK